LLTEEGWFLAWKSKNSLEKKDQRENKGKRERKELPAIVQIQGKARRYSVRTNGNEPSYPEINVKREGAW